jgi:hypothetical protein
MPAVTWDANKDTVLLSLGSDEGLLDFKDYSIDPDKTIVLHLSKDAYMDLLDVMSGCQWGSDHPPKDCCE